MTMDQNFEEEDEVIYDKTSLLRRSVQQPKARRPGSRGQQSQLWRVLSLTLLFTSLGVSLAIPGPTITCFEHLTHSADPLVSCLFAGRAGGILVASLLTHLLLDIVPADCLTVVGLLLLSVANFLIPWSERVWWLVGSFALQGATIGLTLSAALALTRSYFGRRHAPYRHTFLFALAVGCALTPILVMPFQLSPGEVPPKALLNTSRVRLRRQVGLEAPVEAQFPSGPRFPASPPSVVSPLPQANATGDTVRKKHKETAEGGDQLVIQKEERKIESQKVDGKIGAPEMSSETASVTTSTLKAANQSLTETTSNTSLVNASTPSSLVFIPSTPLIPPSAELSPQKITTPTASPSTPPTKSMSKKERTSSVGKSFKKTTSAVNTSTTSDGSLVRTSPKKATSPVIMSPTSTTSPTTPTTSPTSPTTPTTSPTPPTTPTTSPTPPTTPTTSPTSPTTSPTSPPTPSPTPEVTTPAASTTTLPTYVIWRPTEEPHRRRRPLPPAPEWHATSRPGRRRPSLDDRYHRILHEISDLRPVQRIFVALGVLTLVTFALCLHLCCVCRRQEPPRAAPPSAAVVTESPRLFGRRRLSSADLTFLGALLALFFMVCGLEVTLGNWLYPWARAHLQWGPLACLLLTAAFWAGLALGRLPLLAAGRCRPGVTGVLLFLHLLLALAGCILLLLLYRRPAALWGGAALCGFGLGPFRGAMAAWLEALFATGELRWLSVLTLVASGAGEAILPVASAFASAARPPALFAGSTAVAALGPLLFGLVAAMARLRPLGGPSAGMQIHAPLLEEEEEELSPRGVLDSDPEEGGFALRKLRNGSAAAAATAQPGPAVAAPVAPLLALEAEEEDELGLH